ncbi:CLUMA_CG009251, isoform A [Clunio marinus]|uniref:CLUMA_CG009251, isoform A n=1 Tax=Clunio marinus TaxID=568069 RepID=A0A1J1I7T0_9DIPT|nr:CLUMA_CG009251, isoform A [Clunio marinus]
MNFASKSLRITFNIATRQSELKTWNGGKSYFPAICRSFGARNFSQLHSKSSTSPSVFCQSKTDLLPATVPASIMVKRYMSVQELTKNLYLFTEHERKFEKDSKTLRLKQDVDDKPLVVILSWLQSKQTHLSKFAKLYMDQGFDVLVAQIRPWQLLWPVKGSQQVALDIVNFMANNDNYKQMVLHGFSVGGYMWGECLMQMDKDRERYQTVLDRIIGQVWDSAADITEIPVGVPKALFPRNPKLQSALRNYMLYHLKTFQEAATQHYVRSSQLFHINYCHAPALFFVSKTDPVGAEASNRRVADSWISNGVNVTWKCFDKSPHVGHFIKHREEYLNSLFEHLRSINMVKYPELMRAKL